VHSASPSAQQAACLRRHRSSLLVTDPMDPQNRFCAFIRMNTGLLGVFFVKGGAMRKLTEETMRKVSEREILWIRQYNRSLMDERVDLVRRCENIKTLLDMIRQIERDRLSEEISIQDIEDCIESESADEHEMMRIVKRWNPRS
jgi:hypothetical protein